MVLKTSPEAQAALDAYLAEKTKTKGKAALAALKKNYAAQFHQFQKDSKDTKALTAEFLDQVAPLTGINWVVQCNQDNPGGGDALINCLKFHNEPV